MIGLIWVEFVWEVFVDVIIVVVVDVVIDFDGGVDDLICRVYFVIVVLDVEWFVWVVCRI